MKRGVGNIDSKKEDEKVKKDEFLKGKEFKEESRILIVEK